MAKIIITKEKKDGRTYIRIECTPKSPETRALLREFNAEVSQLEKKWKAVVKAREKSGE